MTRSRLIVSLIALGMSLSAESTVGQSPVVAPTRPVPSPRTRNDVRPPVGIYIRDVKDRVHDASKHRHDRQTIFAVERSNAGASVDDLQAIPEEESLVPSEMPLDSTVPPLPDQVPAIAGSTSLDAEDEVVMDPSAWPIPAQVADTRIPDLDDGLTGNRQVSLTPFPNLDIQSAPLAKHQLPWSHKYEEERPFTIPSTMEFQTGVGIIESNGDDEENVGLYNSFGFGMPFWREKGVGVQFAATFEPTTYPQILSEFGFGAFRRALWNDGNNLRLLDRLSVGVGFDGIFDSENRILVGQVRNQASLAIAHNREIGTWFAMPFGDDRATIGSDPDMDIRAAAQLMFYYRHVWPSELDATIFMGAVEDPGGFCTGAYVSYRLSAQSAWWFQGQKCFDEGAGHSVYTGIRLYFRPLESYATINGSPVNRYRMYMPVPDHINLQLRKIPVQ